MSATKKNLTIYHQGSLDEMCSIYAVMNALSLCGLSKDEINAAFKKAVKSLSGHHLILQGYYLSSALKEAIKSIDLENHGIKVDYPFWKDTPKSNAAFWPKFSDLFKNGAICTIIGLYKPDSHWVVAVDEGETLFILDSDLSRKNATSYHKEKDEFFAGDRRPSTNSEIWSVDRKIVIAFYRS